MAKGDHKFRKKPRGSKVGGYARPRVQIGFDPETVKQITRLAKENGRSFAAEVRELTAYGLAARQINPWRENAKSAIGG